jgi:hypothetical protein
MTQATRAALERVSQILHDAGWDASTPEPPELTEQTIQKMRDAYASLLRNDYLEIIQQTLGKGQRVEDAGRVLGMGPQESKSLLAEALTRLVDFAGVAEGEGFIPNGPDPVRTGRVR